MDTLNIKNEINWPALTATIRSTVNANFKIPVVLPRNASEKILPKVADSGDTSRIKQEKIENTEHTTNGGETENTRTREDILNDRKIRHKERKERLRMIKLEEKRLQNLTLHKGKSISIIDKETMNMLTSKSQKCSEINQSVDEMKINPIKHTKSNHPMEINLSSLIYLKVRNPKRENYVINKEHFHVNNNNLDSDKPHMQRGKKYENRLKPLTKLKKIILKSRNEKRHSQINNIELRAADTSVINNFENDELAIDGIDSRLQKICINDNSENKIGDIELKQAVPDVNSPATELKKALKSLITTLFNFQDRAYKKNAIKANMRRRYVVGLREVLKAVKLSNVCMVLVATDIEKINSEGGTTDIINEIESITIELGVPFICALKRREIGYLTHKKVGVSCMAVLNKDGAEDLFKTVLECHLDVIQGNQCLKPS